jgi:signal transduction histidine kinase
MAAALFVLAAFDLVTGCKIRLLSAYAGPIFVLAWFCGKKWGIAAAASASLIWWYVNCSTGDPILHSSSEAWETSWHFGFYLIVALVGSALRTKSDIAADRIALLERSRRLEREVVNISEAEQRRIGQDLHDGLCQYLEGLTCGASSDGVGRTIMRYRARSIDGEATVKRRKHRWHGRLVHCQNRFSRQ